MQRGFYGFYANSDKRGGGGSGERFKEWCSGAWESEGRSLMHGRVSSRKDGDEGRRRGLSAPGRSAGAAAVSEPDRDCR